MKVYCVFECYENGYPEDREYKLIKIYDSKIKAQNFVNEQNTNGYFYIDEKYDCSLTGEIVEMEVY